jgi:hypothetical protein
MSHPTVSSFTGHHTPAQDGGAKMGWNPSSSVVAAVESCMVSLIERATCTIAPTIDLILLCTIKFSARTSGDTIIHDAFHLLSLIPCRCSCMLLSIPNKLFMHSKLFCFLHCHR